MKIDLNELFDENYRLIRLARESGACRESVCEDYVIFFNYFLFFQLLIFNFAVAL